jgi:hypothetical protein
MKGILIFYYIGGAGGKFFANMLTYSGQVAISNYNIAVRNDSAEYNRALLATIPNKQESRTWLTLEHGCNQLFGDAIHAIKSTGAVGAAAKLNDLTLIKDKWLPVMAHYATEVHNIQKYFNNVEQKLIVVDSDPAFIDKCIRLKWADPTHCLDLNVYAEFKLAANNLLPDHRINGWKLENRGSLMSVIDLATALNLTIDFDAANAYFERYLAFHN